MQFKKYERADMVWQDVRGLRERAPLVLNITNYVVMNNTANALLAIGASPVMAHAIEEVEDMVALAGALVINIGTLSEPWVASMRKAGRAAQQRRIPVVFDPVGCSATAYRTRTAQALLEEVRPTIVRGNASEIRALAGAGGGARGVDSRQAPDEVLDDAQRLSRSAGCVVSVSGAVDIVADNARVAKIANGHAMMTRVTGMGCTASAVTGALAAVNASAFEAARNAMVLMGVAGEMAVERAAGPGSLQMHFLDVLHGMREADLTARARVQGG